MRERMKEQKKNKGNVPVAEYANNSKISSLVSYLVFFYFTRFLCLFLTLL